MSRVGTMAIAFCKQADSLLELQRYEGAIELYKKALQVDPNHFLSLHNMGRALHMLGRFDEAVDFYEKAGRANPSESSSFHNIG